jgi:serine/threonine-protein kinase RsbW
MARQIDKEITVSIPMLPDMELAVSGLATALAQTIDLDEDKVDEIKMAIIEACLNAFEHSDSRDRQVHVHFLIKPEKLIITIRDNGQGFNTKSIVSPNIKQVMKSDGSKRGWGLHIIQSLMDDVKIESDQNGTAIIMTKGRD